MQGDQELVRVFLQHGFCQPQLGALHRCRMFLQVLRVSNICTGNGDQLITGNWRHSKPQTSDYRWPKVATPSTTDWNTWDLAISKALNIGRQNRLPLLLGTYLHHIPKGWYFSPEETALWFASGNDWHHHGKIPSRSHTQTFHKHGEIATPTQPLRRATVRVNPTMVTLTGSRRIAPQATMETGINALQHLTFANEWSWRLPGDR